MQHKGLVLLYVCVIWMMFFRIKSIIRNHDESNHVEQANHLYFMTVSYKFRKLIENLSKCVLPFYAGNRFYTYFTCCKLISLVSETIIPTNPHRNMACVFLTHSQFP